jgi:hypothetical protein
MRSEADMDERGGKARSAAMERERPDLRIPLQGIGITLVVTLVLLAVGVVGYVSFQNASAAVNDVAA